MLKNYIILDYFNLLMLLGCIFSEKIDSLTYRDSNYLWYVFKIYLGSTANWPEINGQSFVDVQEVMQFNIHRYG
jgi:hypothetical protein